MEFPDCQFSRVRLFKQNISRRDIIRCMVNTYKHTCFSTFPYLVYKEKSSLEAVQKYNSGNCIALSKYFMMLLKNNYNLESSLIVSSVPKLFRREGTKHICHCSVVVPINTMEFYLIDIGLEFLEPMLCSFKKNVLRSIECSDVDKNSKDNKETIEYILKQADNKYLDKGQILLNDTVVVSCYFSERPDDKWDYYLNCINNPDESIGQMYMYYKDKPFLTYFLYDPVKHNVFLKYVIKMNDDGETFIIKKFHEEIFNGPLNDEIIRKTPLLNEIFYNELHRYFSNYII